MKNWNVENKKAIVTGGSKGIGKAVVKELLSLGATVLFTGRDEAGLEATESELKNKGYNVNFIRGDVTDIESRQVITEWIADKWGHLDILVNNAGTNIRKPTNDYTQEEYLHVINTNLIAPFEFCRLLFPLLKASGNGSIVNIASVAGSFDVQTGVPDRISKSGLIQLTRNLANEWATYKIRVNLVSPWFTETPLTKGLLSDRKRLERIVSRTSLGRIAQDEEIAAVVAFLTMDKASFITGQNLSIDGGVTVNVL